MFVCRHGRDILYPTLEAQPSRKAARKNARRIYLPTTIISVTRESIGWRQVNFTFRQEKLWLVKKSHARRETSSPADQKKTKRGHNWEEAGSPVKRESVFLKVYRTPKKRYYYLCASGTVKAYLKLTVNLIWLANFTNLVSLVMLVLVWAEWVIKSLLIVVCGQILIILTRARNNGHVQIILFGCCQCLSCFAVTKNLCRKS